MRRARITYQGAFHHAMNRGYESKLIFNSSKMKSKFINIMQETSIKLKIRILAYTIMNNHYHLVFQNCSGKMPEFFKQLNGQFGTFYRRVLGGRGYVFQDRYKSMLIQDDSYLLLTISYVLNNPVKAGLVDNYKDYKWSSADQYFRNQRSKLVDNNYVEELFGSESNLVNLVTSSDFKKLPTVRTDVGTIIGGDEFVIRAMEKFDRRNPGDPFQKNIRKNDPSFEPVERIFSEFEEANKIKVNEINIRTYKGKRLRGELLCDLKDYAGLKYTELLGYDIFRDLKLHSLPKIYWNAKKRRGNMVK
jgi:REP element-mobilizing transposase RayT